MLKISAAISGAAVLAAAFAMVTSMTPVDPAAASLGYGKADRLDVRSYGAACSERGWPYYEPNCIRSASAGNETRPVRVVSTDRLAGELRLATAR